MTGKSTANISIISEPVARDEMSLDEFNMRMKTGLEQAKCRQGRPADEVFDDLFSEIGQ